MPCIIQSCGMLTCTAYAKSCQVLLAGAVRYLLARWQPINSRSGSSDVDLRFHATATTVRSHQWRVTVLYLGAAELLFEQTLAVLGDIIQRPGVNLL